VGKCFQHFGVGLRALNVLRFKITDAWHGWGQGTREVVINFAVSSVQASLCHLEKIAILNCVTDMVFWLEGVRTLTLALPLHYKDVFVVHTVMLRFALIRHSVLRAEDVFNADGIPLWNF
jgi:hypothetical protein